MAYFLSPALAQLRAEVNATWPDRSKASDGWIGDTSHQARKSDHNPDYGDGGIVRAIDVTNSGIDVDRFIAAAVADPRTAYVISRGRVWQNPAVYRVSGWRPYSGTNAHDHHVHVSVRHGAAWDQNTGGWGIAGGRLVSDSSTVGGSAPSGPNLSAPTPIAPKEWDEMASKQEIQDAVREVVAEELTKVGSFIASGPLKPNGLDDYTTGARHFYVCERSTMTRRHLSSQGALAEARKNLPEYRERKTADFLRAYTLVK
jgi:hypothetical protein